MAQWDIRIATNAAPAVEHAAQELQSLFAEATGEALPLHRGWPGGQRHVWIGTGPETTANGPDLATRDLGEEDVRIAVRGGNLLIAGGGPRGALYAVYTFLEDELGIRFLTADHTYVPRVTRALVLPRGERTFRPTLGYRHCYYGPNQKSPAFAAHLRMNAVSPDPKLGGASNWQVINHSVSGWVPVRRFGKEHPEYFALVDGRRRSDVPDDHYGEGGTQPCLTDPDVRRLIRDGALAQIVAHPEQADVSVSQNDNRTYCRCPACQAIDEREGAHMGTMLDLVNEVADVVATQHPGIVVGTLAYQYTRRPPAHLRPRPNVAIQLCSIEACVLHPINDTNCPLNREFCRDLAGWSGIATNIHIWNYNVDFRDYLTPLPNLHVIGPNIRFFVANHARGLFMQCAGGSQGTEMADLKNYLICNLMWDPSRDENKLMEEFLTLHYGQAAGPIREWIALIHGNAEQKGIHRACFGTMKDYGIDEGIVKQGEALFDKALAQAESDEVRARVRKAAISVYRAKVEPIIRWCGANAVATPKGLGGNYQWRLAEGAVPAAELLALKPDVERFLRACKEFEVNMFSESIPVEQARTALVEAFRRAGQPVQE